MNGYINNRTMNARRCPQCRGMTNMPQAMPCAAAAKALAEKKAPVCECGGPMSASQRRSFGSCAADEPVTCFE